MRDRNEPDILEVLRPLAEHDASDNEIALVHYWSLRRAIEEIDGLRARVAELEAAIQAVVTDGLDERRLWKALRDERREPE